MTTECGIKGRVAVVTGSDFGMGLKTAELLLREGCRVVLADQETGKVTEAVRSLSSLGDVMPVAADLATTKGALLLHAFAAEAFKDVDPTILVHAAGITGATGDKILGNTGPVALGGTMEKPVSPPGGTRPWCSRPSCP